MNHSNLTKDLYLSTFNKLWVLLLLGKWHVLWLKAERFECHLKKGTGPIKGLMPFCLFPTPCISHLSRTYLWYSAVHTIIASNRQCLVSHMQFTEVTFPGVIAAGHAWLPESMSTGRANCYIYGVGFRKWLLNMDLLLVKCLTSGVMQPMITVNKSEKMQGVFYLIVQHTLM